MLSCKSGCTGRLGPTSSRVSMADPGVVAAVLTVVLGAVPDELTESISPATSWISRAKMAKSLARSWLILRTHGNNLSTIQQTDGGREEVFRAWNHATCAYKKAAVLEIDWCANDQHLAISSLCAVQSRMYSSCSFMRCLTPMLQPGPLTAPLPEPGLALVPSLEPR